MSKDYYQTLGVPETASADEIKKSFRKLAKQYHPDRHHGDKAAEERFKEISEAYDTLSDAKKREQYDMMRKYGAFAGAGQGGSPFGQGNFDFSQFGAQGNGFAFFRSGGMDGSTDIFGDLFSSIFGGGPSFGPGRQGGPRPGPQPGANIETQLTISFDEAVRGAKRVIQLEGSPKKLSVKIPAGIEDGGKIRLRGQGQPSRFRGQSGDLIITVRVMPDKNYERKGNDIYSSVDISFKEAVLGCKKNVKTLTRTVALRIPPGTQPGTVMRLKGLGLAVADNTGDHYVEIKVSVPTTLTDKQKKLLEEWE